ncbi:MAG: tetratricopeptide repeat protein, partial [Candidatus Hydrothermia bacterium]
RNGKFIFKEMEVPEALDLVEVDSLELLVQGARYIDEWEMVSSKLPSFEVVPKYPETLPDGPLSFSPSEWRVLASVDGVRSVREIADQFPESTFEVAKAIVSLLEKGVLEVEERETTPKDVFPMVHRLLLSAWERFDMEEFDQAEDLATQVLALDPTLSAAHLFLAEVYYAQGKYKDAARRYIEAMRRDPNLSPRVNYHLACSLVMSGDFDFAMGVLDEASVVGGHPKAAELKSLLEKTLSMLMSKERSFEE